MNLYLISQRVNNNYDTYDSAVVAAETEEQAKNMHPSGEKKDGNTGDEEWDSYWTERMWAKPEHVTVNLIGVATDDIVAGVVCASFNAG